MSAHDQTFLEDAQTWDEELNDYDERLLSQYYSRIEALEKEKERQMRLRKESVENDKTKISSAPRPLGLGAAKKPIRMQQDVEDEEDVSPLSEIFTQVESRRTPNNPPPSRSTDAPRQSTTRTSLLSLSTKAKLEEVVSKLHILVNYV